MICEPQHNAQTIMCVANALDSEASKIASSIVLMAQAYDIDLVGWKLVLVTPNDWVVTRHF